mmetsp:Transcript_2861/g.8460  ORF Transcript_2861/g.8460 Transcript_2861/m.8460 type:complete len:217 (-) Transcript_2861:593-1243(-)
MSQSSLCSVRASCLLRAASTSASLESTPMGRPVLSERTDCKNDIDGFSGGDRAQDGAGCAAPPAPATGAEGGGDAAATRGGGCGGGGGGNGCWRNVSLARSQTSQRLRPSEMCVDHSQSAAPNATAARCSCLRSRECDSRESVVGSNPLAARCSCPISRPLSSSSSRTAAFSCVTACNRSVSAASSPPAPLQRADDGARSSAGSTLALSPRSLAAA